MDKSTVATSSETPATGSVPETVPRVAPTTGVSSTDVVQDAATPAAPSVQPAPVSTDVVAPGVPAPLQPTQGNTSAISGLTAWKPAKSTVFWVGEGEDEDNGFIHNRASAWNETWEQTYGGYDDPDDRCGYRPCAFTPKQNPFYVALPYNDLTDDGEQKANAKRMPWYDATLPNYESQMDGRWVAVRNGATVCYGQVRDVGPFEQDDTAYVFGTAQTPKNKQGVGAGLDLSPAMRDCLGVGDVSMLEWRFMSTQAVPAGPWHGW